MKRIFRTGIVCGLLSGLALLFASQTASADTVRVHNISGLTVYRLYAWPTRLVPRAYSVLGSPLSTQSFTTVNVDNTYGDCVFTFQYDLNDPRQMKIPPSPNRPRFKKRGLRMFSTNICGPKRDITLR